MVTEWQEVFKAASAEALLLRDNNKNLTFPQAMKQAWKLDKIVKMKEAYHRNKELSKDKPKDKLKKDAVKKDTVKKDKSADSRSRSTSPKRRTTGSAEKTRRRIRRKTIPGKARKPVRKTAHKPRKPVRKPVRKTTRRVVRRKPGRRSHSV